MSPSPTTPRFPLFHRWLWAGISLCSVLTLGACTNLAFLPMREHVSTPQRFGIAFEDRTVIADDGVVLHGWWLPAQTDDGRKLAESARGTVIFVHGNAQNISTHVASVAWMPHAGYNVYLYDFRGFGKSGGRLDYAQSLRDLRKVVVEVSNFPEASGKPLFVFGQSIGGSIVIAALGDHPARFRLAGIITEGSPSSLQEAARDALARSWLTWPLQYPLSWLLGNPERPIDRIGGIAPVPLMLVHSRDDRVVAFAHGERMRDAAPRGHVWLAARGRHIAAFSDPLARQKLLDFLSEPSPNRMENPEGDRKPTR